MKQILFFLLISTSIFAQDFSSIQEKTNSYSGLMTAEKLATKINQDFTTDEDKVKALYVWLTKNIRYDLDEFYNPKRKKTYSLSYQTFEELKKKEEAMNDSIVAKTLNTRRAVCEGYARTFSKVCNLLEIENGLVDGYVRNNASEINKPTPLPGHAWNAVKVNDKWIFVDATWGAGHEVNGRRWVRKFNPYYFDIPKEQLFKTHLPDKSRWKLLAGRMDKKTFYSQPIYSNDFLSSSLELISPTSGTLYKKNGSIEIKLKNVLPSQQIHIAFLGERFAQSPTVTRKNGITNISIVPPTSSKEAYLLIDKEVVLEFIIQ